MITRLNILRDGAFLMSFGIAISTTIEHNRQACLYVVGARHLYEPPVGDHPKCKDLVVANKNRITGGGLSKKRSGHIYFMKNNYCI